MLETSPHSLFISFRISLLFKVNAADENGLTPLLAACRRDAAAHVRVLLACGADVDKTSHNGCTPLMSARSPKIMKMLQATEGQSGYVVPGQRSLIFFDSYD